MIRRLRINTGFVVFLCASMNLMYAAPVAVRTEKPTVKVAFIGIHFEGLEEKVREKIANDFLTMLQLESQLDVKTPSEVEQMLGTERATRLLHELPKDSLLRLGSVLGVDYVFAAKLANESKDSGRIIIVGSFNRYDCLTGASYSYSILRFYQDFREDMKVIKEQFVLTAVPRKESVFTKWPFLVVAGLTLAGIFLLFFSKGKTTGEGQTPPEIPPA